MILNINMADKNSENSSSALGGGGGGDSGGQGNNVAVPIDEQINKTWDVREENILKGWAEKAACYQLMHDRSHKRYWCLNAWFAIPIIIFSTITGTGNFAQESLEDSLKLYFVYSILQNILTAFYITTIFDSGQKRAIGRHHFRDEFTRKIKAS